jgi:hypothetical protein
LLFDFIVENDQTFGVSMAEELTGNGVFVSKPFILIDQCCTWRALPVDNSVVVKTESGQTRRGWLMPNNVHFLFVILGILQPSNHL